MSAPEFPEIELAMISKALSGDAGGLYRIASNLMEEGVPFDSVLFDYLIATERSVGQRWAQGDYLVAEEHAVTAAVETVIALLAGMFDQPADAPSLVVTTAEGDAHSLPARATAAHLVYLGYRTTFLGADVPGDDLGDFLKSELPSAVVLSAAMTTHLLGARAVVNAAHEVGIPVIVGGKAFGPGGRWSDATGADAYVGSLRDVADIVDRWVRDGTLDIEPVTELPAELQRLVSNRETLLARAVADMGSDSGRLKSEAGLLLGAIEGALLTGDDQVLADMLAWQEETLRAHGLEASVVADAVAASLSGLSDEGGAALARARAAGR